MHVHLETQYAAALHKHGISFGTLLLYVPLATVAKRGMVECVEYGVSFRGAAAPTQHSLEFVSPKNLEDAVAAVDIDAEWEPLQARASLLNFLQEALGLTRHPQGVYIEAARAVDAVCDVSQTSPARFRRQVLRHLRAAKLGRPARDAGPHPTPSADPSPDLAPIAYRFGPHLSPSAVAALCGGLSVPGHAVGLHPARVRQAETSGHGDAVLCQNVLLLPQAVRRLGVSGLFRDSKELVDRPLLNPPSVVLVRLHALGPRPARRALAQFVAAEFGAPGSDLVRHSPADFAAEPPFLAALRPDPGLRAFAAGVHGLWGTTAYRVASDVRANPCQHTLLSVPAPFFVPGGRFREMYYWDSCFIIQGLLVCGARHTPSVMQWVVENATHRGVLR